MIRAVLEANVLASGFAGMRKPESTPGEIVRRWRAQKFELIVSDYLRSEALGALQQPYFRHNVSPTRASRAAAFLQFKATQTPITAEVHGVATHPEDDLVLATAVSGNATFLVTGDEKLQKLRSYQGVTLLSPREFLDRLTSNE